jgi:hypothetical protein
MSIATGRFCDVGDIELSGLMLNTVDERGVIWVVNDVDGWWTIPEPDILDHPRGFGDGSHPSTGRYAARTFTVTGMFIPPDHTEVSLARNKLTIAANLCHKGAWFATHEVEATKASFVVLSGTPQISTVNARGQTIFSIGLRAPDPVKYGLKDRLLPGWETMTTTASTPITVNNMGTTAVHPTLKISGPLQDPIAVKNETTGTKLVVVNPSTTVGAPVLAAGETLTVDTRNHSVSLTTGGNTLLNQRKYLAYDTQWPMLDPGDNVVIMRKSVDDTVIADGTLEVQWRPGWIA